MRGGQGASPWTSSMEGLGNTACSLECLACLNHVHGWTIWGGYGTLPLKPRFLVASDRSKLLGDGSVWILVTSGSLNSNSTRARTSLVPKPLPSCVHSPVTGLFPRTPGSVSSSHHPVPASKSNVRLGIPNRLSIQRTMYGVTDSCAKRLASTVPVRQQVSGVFLLLRPTTRRYEIDLATHRASQGHAKS